MAIAPFLRVKMRPISQGIPLFFMAYSGGNYLLQGYHMAVILHNKFNTHETETSTLDTDHRRRHTIMQQGHLAL